MTALTAVSGAPDALAIWKDCSVVRKSPRVNIRIPAYLQASCVIVAVSVKVQRVTLLDGGEVTLIGALPCARDLIG